MLWLKKDSILCGIVLEFYEIEDYIRDYDEFVKEISCEQSN